MIYDTRTQTVGVDVGNGTICTVNDEFVAGIQEVLDSAVAQRKATIDGITYVLGEKTWNYMVDRTENDECKNITHYAVVNELIARGLPAGRYEINLGVGLPFQHWSGLKEKLKTYYHDGKIHTVKVGDKVYEISYAQVAVMPQGYSALVDQLGSLKGRTVVLADIGDGTLDVVLYEDSVAKEAGSFTEVLGVKECFKMAKNKYKNLSQHELSRNAFEQYIRGKNEVSRELRSCIQEAEEEYCRKILYCLKEGGYEEDAMSLIIMGGGANIVKAYGGAKFAKAEYILDSKANAKGYEVFMRKYQERMEV